MMKVINFLLGAVLIASASVVNATTVLVPTDGDINFSLEFGALTGVTLAIFDEETDFGGANLVVDVPDLIYVNSGSSLHYNADFSDLGLSIDGDFVLAVSGDGTTTWVGGEVNFGSVFTVPESNFYAITFDGFGGFEVVVDVSPVPVPAAVWLFGSGLIGLVGVARRKA